MWFSESISFIDTSLVIQNSDTSSVIKNSEFSESISVLDTRLVNSDTSLVIKNSEFSESISVLDTSLVIKNSEIIVDLYKKPTDRNLYLLPSSCHSPHVVHNIPFSLAFRIVRICSEELTRDKRLEELKNFLLERNYRLSLIESAIKPAKAIPRNKALLEVAKDEVNPIQGNASE